MKTKHDIEIYMHTCFAIIPKGTEVIEAHNLPRAGFWACPWPGMSDQEESWQRNYGFLLGDEEVTE